MVGIDRPVRVAGFFAIAALLLAACGGGEPTATPLPMPTATPTQVPGPAPTAAAAPTATATPAPTPTPRQVPGPAPTAAAAPPATATPAPAPTPMPSGTLATPVLVQGGKRGGVLNTSIRTSFIATFDTFSAGGRSAIAAYNPLLNNLLWTDPYGKGLVGDVAEGWLLSEGGRVITFTLRKGIQFHDGKPLTAKDVAYNPERAWKPRSPQMLEFQGKLDALEKVETPDDFTVRLRLKTPSNYLLVALSINQFLIYPAHMPLPESDQQWKRTGIGSGPFRLKEVVADTGIQLLRHENYWKPGLPYLDGVLFHAINDDALVVSAYRTGKLDALNLEVSPLQSFILDGTLQREVGWVRVDVLGGGLGVLVTQREPFSNPKVREALDLAMDRQDVLRLAYFGAGTALSSPLIPPQIGGQWGIPEAEMKDRPGYRENKAQDLARARALLAEAGLDPSKVNVRILGSPPQFRQAETVEQSVRELGFKTQVVLVQSIPQEALTRPGAYELIVETVTVQADDPTDYLGPLVQTGGGRNYFKWSEPEVDRLLKEQDEEVDAGKRRRLLRDLQERVMNNRDLLVLSWRHISIGHNRFVKNFYTNALLQQGHRFRWEQVWLER